MPDILILHTLTMTWQKRNVLNKVKRGREAIFKEEKHGKTWNENSSSSVGAHMRIKESLMSKSVVFSGILVLTGGTIALPLFN